MRKRWVIISVLLITLIQALVVGLWFPPPKRIAVPMTYSIVTNKIARWRPAPTSRGLASDVRADEKSAGTLFIRSIFERGDPKFGPFTVVRVSKLDASNTAVELSTTQADLFDLFGRRHLFFLERQRWKEIQEVIRQ